MIQDILLNLIAGFQAALTFWNLFFVILGVAVGILFGVLPGVGGVTALSILIPVTFYMEPITALAFLVGITKGGTSGGAIPAILLNAPGSSEKRGHGQRRLSACAEGPTSQGDADGALFLSVRRRLFPMSS